MTMSVERTSSSEAEEDAGRTCVMCDVVEENEQRRHRYENCGVYFPLPLETQDGS